MKSINSEIMTKHYSTKKCENTSTYAYLSIYAMSQQNTLTGKKTYSSLSQK